MTSKYALCIGNNYPGTDSELAGCVNDANDWMDLLRVEGYQVTQVIEATKSHAIEELTRVVSGARRGDRVVLTYSGHGSWVPDRDGDETDGRDECLVMTDFENGGLLLDDELHEIFSSSVTGVGSLILSDSCHSGTVLRHFGEVRSTGTPRYLSPARFLDLSEQEVERREETVTPTPPRNPSSLISGCEDVEYSYDAWFGQRANGAFTRAAIDTYRSGVSMAGWYRAIRTVLPSDDYPQTPRLTAKNRYRRYADAL
jgi:hypothetical protein